MLIKFVINTLLIALLSFAAGLYFPNWIIAFVAFGVSLLIPLRPLLAFLAGFTALFLLWGGMAMAADLPNNGMLATKIALILPLNGSHYALVLVTAFVGALVGGSGALTAAFLKTR